MWPLSLNYCKPNVQMQRKEPVALKTLNPEEESMATPWAIEVQKYAAARAPELHSLLQVLKFQHSRETQEKEGTSQDAAFSFEMPSHLRRRTTSHNRRRYMFWTRRKQQQKQREKAASLAMKKAHENEHGNANMTNPSAEAKPAINFEDSKEKREGKRKLKLERLSRRVRRKIEFKPRADGTIPRSRDGTQRLGTHVWHAKRFKMCKLWGYWLASGLSGRGHGSKSLLRSLKTGALLHDTSYYNVIEVEGSLDSILMALDLLLLPQPSTCKSDILQNLDAYSPFCSAAMVHHCGKAPFQAIGPATVIWRPCNGESTMKLVGSQVVATDSVQATQDGDVIRDKHQKVWILIHPAAFEEAVMSLNAAFLEVGNGEMQYQQRKDLARLDLFGTKAVEVLQKVLIPTRCSGLPIGRVLDEVNAQDSQKNPFFSEDKLLLQANSLPPKSVLAYSVYDPRDVPTFEDKVSNVEFECEENMDCLSGNAINISETPEMEFEMGPAECKWVTGNGSVSLWEHGSLVKPPVSEKGLCKQRQLRRLAYFHLSKDGGILKAKGNGPCPIMLLKHEEDASNWWSIILPLSWVRSFWLSLLSAGVHVIGQRERRWLLTSMGLPSFPFDFPDCSAYACHTATELVARAEKDERRPHNKQLMPELVPPPWRYLDNVFVTGLNSCSVEDAVVDNTVKHMDVNESESKVLCPSMCGSKSNPLPLPRGSYSFNGIVPHATSTLANYLRESNLSHLMVFPFHHNADENSVMEGKVSFRDSINAEKNIIPKNLVTGCLLCILVHAARKGILDEGAALYMPSPNDFQAWLCSSGRWNGVIVPKKNFRRDHQKGKENYENNSLRTPIGFVTSAPPRGSETCSAIAFCEVSALGRLRSWQMLDSRWAKRMDFFLLFQNERSTKLRPALATATLEYRLEDL